MATAAPSRNGYQTLVANDSKCLQGTCVLENENSTSLDESESNVQFNLEEPLQCLNEEQYLTLFSLYGQEAIDRFKKLINNKSEKSDEIKKRLSTVLANYIQTDPNQERKYQLKQLVESYQENYQSKKENLKNLQKECKESKEELDRCVNGFNNEIDGLVDNENSSLLEKEKLERELNKAQVRRQKRIKQGLKAHLRAVACAVIEGGEQGGKAYIEEANQQAQIVLKQTVAVVNEMETKEPDPKSVEGMEIVLETLFPKEVEN